MTDPTAVLFAATLTREELETGLRDYEASSGPALSIAATEPGAKKTVTVATFDRTKHAPDREITVVVLDKSGKLDVPPGMAKVAEGTAFIEGARTKVLLVR